MDSNHEEKIQQKLEALLHKEEEESTKLLSQKYKLPYVDLFIFPIESDALLVLSENDARTGEIAVFQITGKRLKIAVRNPERETTRAALKRLENAGHTYELVLCSQHSLMHAWKLYEKLAPPHEVITGAIHISHQAIETLRNELIDLQTIRAAIEHALHGRTTDILEMIIAGSLSLDASDVHIEPATDQMRIRFRIDGVLHDVSFVPLKAYRLLLSRIKLISELKLNIHDRAQDGRFTIRAGDIEIEMRTSVLPGPNGENVVLRILNPKGIEVQFEALGMQPWTQEQIEREMKKPNGMIITTGPTGSGKTTTLYTIIKKLYSPTLKIITIEDPIEYHLAGIEQTQVDAEKGYDFANGLRSIVRQDPDVLLVGEIRDLETADTAINAALTGHLVLSTLHTNNAAGAIPRLISIGIKPNVIAPALNVIMAQRLVRKLCKECREAVRPNKEESAKIARILASFPSKILIPPEKERRYYHAHKGGCMRCNEVGYKGRISIFEIILMNDEIELLILKTPTESDLKKAAFAQGQITMQHDGLLKIFAGITDLAELERVAGE